MFATNLDLVILDVNLPDVIEILPRDKTAPEFLF